MVVAPFANRNPLGNVEESLDVPPYCSIFPASCLHSIEWAPSRFSAEVANLCARTVGNDAGWALKVTPTNHSYSFDADSKFEANFCMRATLLDHCTSSVQGFTRPSLRQDKG